MIAIGVGRLAFMLKPNLERMGNWIVGNGGDDRGINGYKLGPTKHILDWIGTPVGKITGSFPGLTDSSRTASP